MALNDLVVMELMRDSGYYHMPDAMQKAAELDPNKDQIIVLTYQERDEDPDITRLKVAQSITGIKELEKEIDELAKTVKDKAEWLISEGII